MKRLAQIVLVGVAVVSLANALWMLGSAWHWFEAIPGVSDTGTPNGHFIRDVGIVYGLFGATLLWILKDPLPRHPTFVVATLFYVGHALDHVVEIVVGALPLSHWLIDSPLVFLPAVALGALALPKVWRGAFAAQ